ncbi:uncharacterized protein LOC106644044 [Copidosoma floridanum]|uniref:uncharacterized protein LOC106644044 n=1 Tax=Copidosoma floridanum TaxID=29053 RepID=UPI000C6F4532|nr:uncharacterized protein LOC106644044 [Copidosoma floridanum]
MMGFNGMSVSSSTSRFMREHLQPVPCVIVERYRLRECQQQENQDIKGFEADLKRLSTYCEFKANRENSLRDQFVWGLAEENIKKRLLGERDLTYQRALELAFSWEAAKRDAAGMNAGKENSLNFVSTKTENKSKKLSEKCGEAGNLRKACKQGSSRSENDQAKKGARQNFVEEVDNLSEDFKRLCNIKSVHALKPEKPLEVMLTVQNTQMSFKIDTGSSLSAVSYENYVASKELRVLRTKPTARVLRAYPGDKIIPKGIINVNVVVQNAIFDEFKDVFSDTLGCYNKRKFSLQLKEGTIPVFKKPSLYQPVKSRQWATPLVPVLKANGEIRLCGDFKVTVNPCLEIDRHPIPRLSDLSTKLAGGKIFRKLDRNQAYQQVLVDNESKQLLVLSTHKGLYACNRLMYGVASAPGLFQREIETLLHDIKGGVPYFDDIFISGPTKTEHDKSLREVLKRLQECNLTLKNNKCSISKDKITFLRLELDAEDPPRIVQQVLAQLNYNWTESNKEVKLHLDQIRPGLRDSLYIYVDDFSDQLLNDTAKALDVNPVPEPKTVASETLPVLSKKDPAASSNWQLVLRRSSRIKKAPERLDL